MSATNYLSIIYVSQTPVRKYCRILLVALIAAANPAAAQQPRQGGPRHNILDERVTLTLIRAIVDTCNLGDRALDPAIRIFLGKPRRLVLAVIKQYHESDPLPHDDCIIGMYSNYRGQ